MEKIPVKKFSESTIIDIANQSNSKSLSIMDMLLQADFFVQIIMLILVLMSIYSWSIAIEKFILLKSVIKEFKIFNKLLLDSNFSINHIEEKTFFKNKKVKHIRRNNYHNL